MGYVRSHKFCCCLPVRFGVFVMSAAASLGGGLVAVASWIQVKNLHEHPVSKGDERALYINAIIFSILALVGAFGLFGTMSKKTSLVSLFGSMLGFHLGFSIATGVYAMFTLFKRNSDEALADCVNGSMDADTIDGCKNGLKLLKVLVVTAYVVTWLIELYGCIIVSSYVKQLKEEEAVRDGMAATPNAPVTVYAPPATYAFTQPGQSHGHQV
ncbi:hypothetical protein FB451DRAFT_1081087 [Mycena latifolia]|nr:hypothetical protein FB451DRAFT_1081087 [Mycena latifolia]